MEWLWYHMVLLGGGSSDKARRGLERLPLLGLKLALVGAGVLFSLLLPFAHHPYPR